MTKTKSTKRALFAALLLNADWYDVRLVYRQRYQC